MGWINRLSYPFGAIRRSRSIAVKPFTTLLFFITPEPIANFFKAICLFRWHGLNFWARRADWGPVESVLLGGEYDFVEQLLAKFSRPVVVDLGANIGTFALFVFRQFPAATVYSVEASGAVAQVLDRNRQLNPGYSWQTCRAAVWNASGFIRFQTGRQASTQGRVSQDGDEMVPTITLSNLLNDHVKTRVTLLKMDIEGAEAAVLPESAADLRQVEQVLVQIHPQRIDQEQVLSVLRREFNFLYHVPHRLSPNPLIVATRQPQNANLELIWERSDRVSAKVTG